MYINTEEAVKYILREMYRKEMEIIDGRSEHPEDLNFEEWVIEKGLNN